MGLRLGLKLVLCIVFHIYYFIVVWHSISVLALKVLFRATKTSLHVIRQSFVKSAQNPRKLVMVTILYFIKYYTLKAGRIFNFFL